jgi:hypothetical protein
MWYEHRETGLESVIKKKKKKMRTLVQGQPKLLPSTQGQAISSARMATTCN